MNDLRTDVLNAILESAQSIKYSGLMLNERYLHHSFSHLLQEKYNLLNLTGDNRAITLHPEWPTYKEQTSLTFGRYRRVNGIYKPNASGTAGFIDFAIGDYNKPDIGIEFSLKYGWSHEEIVYDFLKLLDRKNPFKASISFNILFRKRELVKGERYLRDLEEHMNNAYREAVSRLNNDICDDSRELYLIVTEIDKDNNRRHWHYDRTSSRFKEGLPVIA
ncbi:hypothetical protein FJZ33_10510 [Candidatus Poribacteria bacterium]|nr:hypothetical protein [Candidatus Poribacteria bacterium]